MKFEWDEQKRLTNIRKHGLDFEDAKEMFEHPMFIRQDSRFDYDEDRWVGIGLTKNRVALSFTWSELMKPIASFRYARH